MIGVNSWGIEPMTEPHAPPSPACGGGQGGGVGPHDRSRGRAEETQLAGQFEDARPRPIAAPGHDQGRAGHLLRRCARIAWIERAFAGRPRSVRPSSTSYRIRPSLSSRQSLEPWMRREPPLCPPPQAGEGSMWRGRRLIPMNQFRVQMIRKCPKLKRINVVTLIKHKSFRTAVGEGGASSNHRSRHGRASNGVR